MSFPSRVRAYALLPLAALVASTGCVLDPTREVRPLVDGLISGFGTDQWEAVPNSAPVRSEVDTLLQGMDGIRPIATVRSVRMEGDRATAELHLTWPLPSGEWTYATTANFTKEPQGWRLRWTPATLHPELTSDRRLVHRRVDAGRGRIVNPRGDVLAGPEAVLRLGLNKKLVPAPQQERTARTIAGVVGVDAGNFARRVAAAGPEAFVEALVVRGSGKGALPAGFADLPGASAYPDTRVLPRERGFAEELLGQVGEATAEDVQRGNGSIRPGQQLGRSGLQQRYDPELTGRPGARVVLVDRANGNQVSGPVYAKEPTPGADLVITLDPTLQARAETALERVPSAASIAIVRPSTGEILALANGPGSQGAADANNGRYAPGSTFKIVTALALLRTGQSPRTPMTCNATTTVDGRKFKNYNDFPPSRLGPMTLKDAIATSCNTALIDQHERITGPGLRDAASSLGLGVDHDLGFPVYFGSIPDPTNTVGVGESIIGQASIQSSPLAMAGVAASVSAGHTVIPHLLAGKASHPTSPRLTPDEARQLQELTHAVVNGGSGRILAAVAEGAKTGTAEYGTDTPLKTHAWMIAHGHDLAVAAFVKDGDSGSGTAGPLVKAVLSG
ncbi:penicillin-binding protein [Naumannella sp. ID2617S]|nr:penicillin-binding protein [Naumannella sp. ID2617S]